MLTQQPEFFGENCETTEDDCIVDHGLCATQPGTTCVDCSRYLPSVTGFGQGPMNPACPMGFTCDGGGHRRLVSLAAATPGNPKPIVSLHVNVVGESVLQPSTENADGNEDSAGAAVASAIVAELAELTALAQRGLRAEAVDLAQVRAELAQVRVELTRLAQEEAQRH